MPQQVGCQSGSRPSIHNHSNASQGGPIVLEERIIGAAVTISNLAIHNTNAANYAAVNSLCKEVVVQEDSSGTCTITFTLVRSGGAGAVNAQIFINNIAVGTDQSSNPGPDIWAEVITQDLVAGDRIQIKAHNNAGGAGKFAAVSLMTIKYSNSLNAIATHELTALLATNYAIPIQTYNSVI